MKVLKFGGSSLLDASRIEAVAGILRKERENGPTAAVVSALGGVTDALAEASALCIEGKPPNVEGLEKRHLQLIDALAPPEEASRLRDEVRGMFRELGGILQGVSLLRECTPRTRDLILSFGERLSATLVAAALRGAGLPAQACDARRLVLTNDAFGAAQVDLDGTLGRMRGFFQDYQKAGKMIALPAGRDSRSAPLQVVTGFVGATAKGETTTLGRGGSDYTAALVGAALQAEAVEIWTDVDGVMSADPRLVPEAFSLPSLSYDELMELSHFGAKVIYPPTVHPARQHSIPLVIRNTLNPSFPGTRITARRTSRRPEDLIRGISSISRAALMRLEGDGMVGVPGICGRLFSAIATEGVNVILITQASSEHSICFALSPESVERAKKRVHREFALERHAGLVNDLVAEDDLCIIAAVGEGMRERPGIAGRIFQVLGENGINVRAIAQGSSELNISLVLKRSDEQKALSAIHSAFFGGEGG